MAEIVSVQPVLMVRDVARSLAFYRRLGFEKTCSDRRQNARYAAIRHGNCELHLQRHDPLEWTYPVDRPTTRFVVDDVDGLHSHFLKARIQYLTKPAETLWGTYEFHLQDPDGNGLHFYTERDRQV
ncbi:MAG TPA: VOC family protein [Wenzhouxiangella sp.]|nr:VOC family protein [Wenzhouxiangella sp.]